MAHGTETETPTRYSGRKFTARELTLVREVVERCSSRSRTELARTVCELRGWNRPSGELKARECREFLERLESASVLGLPGKARRRPLGSRTRGPVTARGARGRALVGEVGDFGPIELEAVETADQRLLCRELVGRHHYLGHAVPFGAPLRYLVYASSPARTVVGCVQFSSPAWRMAVRDAWIGWDDATRQRTLQRVVHNSRFLILPWGRVKHLARYVLALALRRLAVEWPRQYGVDVLVVETLVDPRRYRGHCYRAANWIGRGETAGRGRMETSTVLGETPWRRCSRSYPLVKDAAHRLRQA